VHAWEKKGNEAQLSRWSTTTLIFVSWQRDSWKPPDIPWLQPLTGKEVSVFTKSIAQSIALLLTDVAMRNISWPRVGRVLGIDSLLPILFTSGDAWCAHLRLECIAKPFQRAELVASVSRALKVTTRLKVMTLGA